MAKRHLILGAIFSGLAVAIGAFGAHSLKNLLTQNLATETFDTGVQYHMFHALGILVIGVLMMHRPHPLLKLASYFFVAGIIAFSGSLYAYSITDIRYFAMIPPIGGFSFLGGWIILIAHLYKHDWKSTSAPNP